MNGEFEPVLTRVPTSMRPPRNVHETHHGRGKPAKTMDAPDEKGRAQVDAEFELQFVTLTDSARRLDDEEKLAALSTSRDELGEGETEAKPRIDPTAFVAGVDSSSLARQTGNWSTEAQSGDVQVHAGNQNRGINGYGPIGQHRADETDRQGPGESGDLVLLEQVVAQEDLQAAVSLPHIGPAPTGIAAPSAAATPNPSIADRPLNDWRQFQKPLNTMPLDVISSQTHYGAYPPVQFLSARSQATISTMQSFESRIDIKGSSDDQVVSRLSPLSDGIASSAMSSNGNVEHRAGGDKNSSDEQWDGRGSADVNARRDDAIAQPKAVSTFAAASNSSMMNNGPTISAQVHDQIKEAVREFDQSSSVALPARPPMVRNIEILLQPQSFGPLVLELKVNAGVMEVAIWTTNTEVARVLDNDKLDLDAKLKTAGVELTSWNVTVIPELSRAADTPAAHSGGTLGSGQHFNREDSVGQQLHLSNGSGGDQRRREGSQSDGGPRGAANSNNSSKGRLAERAVTHRALYV